MHVKNLGFLTTLVDSLPALARQPQAIAVILSVVFHGLLFGAGPSFSSLQMEALRGDRPEAEGRPMPLLALTPEEQSRLPDFNHAAILPPDQVKDLKTTGDGYSFPSGSFRSALNFNHLPSLPVPKSSLGSDPFGTSNRTLVLPLPSLFGSGDGPIVNRSRSPRPTQPALGDHAQGHQSSLSPSQGAMVPPASTMTALSQGQSAPSAEPTDRFKSLVARMQYSPENTSDREVEAASQSWIAGVRGQLGQDPKAAEQPLTLEIPYDLRLCLDPAPGPGLMGFALVPGEKAGTAKLSLATLKSTGYAFLNAQALDKMQTQVAQLTPAPELGKLYQVVVKVNYDSKVCLNRQSLLKPQDSQPNPPQ
ncbi:MAG: hypothetical protein KGQ93_05365 [Cyanobacteria bacterium REEB459]|nr:hypothetical protein [Cyanobacteria bacterium REEB459]